MDHTRRTALLSAAALCLVLGGLFWLAVREDTPVPAAAPAAVAASTDNWGLSFQTEGEPPVGNATAQSLAQYDAYYVGDTTQKVLYLTFDCGYENGNTPRILEALKKHRAPATFFVVGKEAEKRPELVARMAAEGHAVGNHSYSHDGINITGRDEMIADYDKCSDLIQQYTGKRPTLMRAVGGSSVESIRDYIVAQDLRLCGWMGGGPDYNQTDKDVVVGYYMKDGRCTIADGDLVLLHENHASSVAAALELMDLLMQEGYRCVTVPELLAARADGGVAGNTYNRVVSMD